MPRAFAPPRQSHTNNPYPHGAEARGMVGRAESSGGNEIRGSAGAGRTRNGCLMCRWRKKGCSHPIDENGNVPSGCCGVCNELEIPCLGYQDPQSRGQSRGVLHAARAAVLLFIEAMKLKRPSHRYEPAEDRPGFTGTVEVLALHDLFHALGRLKFQAYFGPALEASRTVETPAVSLVAHNSPLQMSSAPASPSELLEMLNHPAFSSPPAPTLDVVNNLERPSRDLYWALLCAAPVDATIPPAPSTLTAPHFAYSSHETLIEHEGANEPENVTTDPASVVDKYFEY